MSTPLWALEPRQYAIADLATRLVVHFFRSHKIGIRLGGIPSALVFTPSDTGGVTVTGTWPCDNADAVTFEVFVFTCNHKCIVSGCDQKCVPSWSGVLHAKVSYPYQGKTETHRWSDGEIAWALR